MRVLIIESSAQRAALIRSGLADQGYVAEVCPCVERGCDRGGRVSALRGMIIIEAHP